MHHWLAKRGLVPVTFSSSEVSLFVNCNAGDDLPFFLKDGIDLPLTLWCDSSEVNELLTVSRHAGTSYTSFKMQMC